MGAVPCGTSVCCLLSPAFCDTSGRGTLLIGSLACREGGPLLPAPGAALQSSPVLVGGAFVLQCVAVAVCSLSLWSSASVGHGFGLFLSPPVQGTSLELLVQRYWQHHLFTYHKVS